MEETNKHTVITSISERNTASTEYGGTPSLWCSFTGSDPTDPTVTQCELRSVQDLEIQSSHVI